MFPIHKRVLSTQAPSFNKVKNDLIGTRSQYHWRSSLKMAALSKKGLYHRDKKTKYPSHETTNIFLAITRREHVHLFGGDVFVPFKADLDQRQTCFDKNSLKGYFMEFRRTRKKKEK